MAPAGYRVVHVAEDLSAVAGGVPSVVRTLSALLAARGVGVRIVFGVGDGEGLAPGVEAEGFPPGRFGRPWYWGGGLTGALERLARDRDRPRVFHVHGIWSAPQYFAARVAVRTETPFVLSAHGMLEPWLWTGQGRLTELKKRAYWRILVGRSLAGATVVHAITPLERKHLEDLFPAARIRVIPNAIDPGSPPKEAGGPRPRRLLFLGRIEPKKGLDLLVHAFAQARLPSEWRLDVVGPTWSEEYLRQVKFAVADTGLQERVVFHGPLFGREKDAVMDAAWVMVVPSHSEAVGLVNLEAAARCLPTITTHQTGLYDWEEGGGLLIEPRADEVRRALEAACSWSDAERRERGAACRRLIEDRYSWRAVLPQWLDLYSQLAL